MLREVFNVSRAEELKDITIAVLAVTFIFAYDYRNPANVINALPFTFVAVVTAFIGHELAHIFAAKKFGCAAIYKLWLPGIVFGLLFMLIGIKFVAPGAVMIYPYTFSRWGFKATYLTATEYGLIALAGPVVNLAFAAFFRLLPGGLLTQSAWINAWLALLNLLPIVPLDGSKIFEWKPWLWFLFILFAGLLLFV